MERCDEGRHGSSTACTWCLLVRNFNQHMQRCDEDLRAESLLAAAYLACIHCTLLSGAVFNEHMERCDEGRHGSSTACTWCLLVRMQKQAVFAFPLPNSCVVESKIAASEYLSCPGSALLAVLCVYTGLCCRALCRALFSTNTWKDVTLCAEAETSRALNVFCLPYPKLMCW